MKSRMYFGQLNSAERHVLHGIWKDKSRVMTVTIAIPTSLEAISYMASPWLGPEEQAAISRFRKQKARRRARRALGRGRW